MAQRTLVIVVDDDAGLLKSVARLLARHGIESRTFASAEALLESDSVQTASCLLLDIHLGGTVGGQIGYRMQSGQWVYGIEGQGNWADFSGDNVSAIPGFGTRNRSRIDSFGLITGQVGYAWNNTLFYVKGGAAVVSDKYDVFDLPTGALFSSARETRWGGTVGAGLEYGFAPNCRLASSTMTSSWVIARSSSRRRLELSRERPHPPRR